MEKEKLNLSKEHFYILSDIMANLCVIASIIPECDEFKIMDKFIREMYPYLKKYFTHYLEELKISKLN